MIQRRWIKKTEFDEKEYWVDRVELLLTINFPRISGNREDIFIADTKISCLDEDSK